MSEKPKKRSKKSSRASSVADRGSRQRNKQSSIKTVKTNVIPNTHASNLNLAEWKECFDIFDRDHSGMIKTQELGIILRSLGLDPSEESIKKCVKKFDPDGTGQMDEKTFMDLMKENQGMEITEEQLMNAFRVFDREGNGKIDIQELSQALTKMGEPMTQKQVDSIFEDADIDQNGQLAYKEFIERMQVIWD